MRRSVLVLAWFLSACTPAVPPGGWGTGPTPSGGGRGPAPSVDVGATRDAYVATKDPFGETVTKVVYLDQGWSPSRSLDFYFTTQGSQIIPYPWFLALEQADSTTPFR